MISVKLNTKNINLKKIILGNKYIVITAVLVILTITTLILFGFYYKDRVFPGVKVLEFNLSGKRMNEIPPYLAQMIQVPEKVEFSSNEKAFELSLEQINLNYDYNKVAIDAHKAYRDRSFLENFVGAITSPFKTQGINLHYSLDYSKLDEYLQVVSEQVLSEPIYPNVIMENGKLSVNKGSPGEILDKKALLSQLEEKILNADFSKTDLPLKTFDPSLTDKEAHMFEKRSEIFIGKTIILNNEYDTYTVSTDTVLTFLNFRNEFDTAIIDNYISSEIIPKVERSPQNAVLRFENEKVIEFTPAKDGLKIEKELLIERIIGNLKSLENTDNKSYTINIPVSKSAPEITLNEVNNLGIKELLGRGASKFRGSIPGRIHNVSLASSKFDGVLIPPGTTFSFNNTLGDVSTFTGYQQAYIIKDGKTVLGDGGGVCQVSTTFFRAILDAGLPINERRAHSYRVSYYEQGSPPGLDATVFSPTTDLKFTNDTPGHLLIQTQFSATNYSLVFEIYGTSDGRVSTISKPITTSSVEPPEDLYIDDPTLPVGTIKQIDYKAWGAKVVFDYKVERDGQNIIEKTFVSNYQPWQAVFLRGTAPPI